ncbi:P2X purinoceptor 1-like [Planoprotostelium fungivorum]|uniref:P2X purinoceptor 1-like n=1 Tax=Planoprotostelium fungivorum TaxID=1890364 RepID=A0A2P6NR82_9EUKA|nr:P2X purinoceptor 1-like [Planoprotostelium fungivorum]
MSPALIKQTFGISLRGAFDGEIYLRGPTLKDCRQKDQPFDRVSQAYGQLCKAVLSICGSNFCAPDGISASFFTHPLSDHLLVTLRVHLLSIDHPSRLSEVMAERYRGHKKAIARNSTMRFKKFLSGFLVYETVRVVEIRHWKLAVFNYLIQIAIIAYIGGYDLYWSKGYQAGGPPIGEVLIKVKGAAYTMEDGDRKIWDVNDLVIPTVVVNSVFMITNMQVTLNQTREVCGYAKMRCKTDADCASAKDKTLDSGIGTGNCHTDGFCAVDAWCPMDQSDDEPPNLVYGVGNWTLFPKVVAQFPDFGIRSDNTKGNVLKKGYNLWTVSDILSELSPPLTIDDVREQGIVVFANVNWQCNFDYDESLCDPSFSFSRVDDPHSFSAGFNVRSVKWSRIPTGNGTETYERRDLFKYYGVRVFFINSGVGRKFSAVDLFFTLASDGDGVGDMETGIAVLSAASIVTDFLAVNFLPQKEEIRKHKQKELVPSRSERAQLPSYHQDDEEDEDDWETQTLRRHSTYL